MNKDYLSDLPKVRGTLKKNYSLKHLAWLKIGGNAEVFFRPADTDDLRLFLKDKPADVPVTIIGNASNVLIRDSGIEGVTIHLGDWFNNVYKAGDVLEAGGSTSCRELSRQAADFGIAGFEFLSTIPGSVGGALRMNAGCFGCEIKDLFIEAEGMTKNGIVKWFSTDNLKFSYRTSSLPEEIIVTRIWLKGRLDSPEIIEEKMRHFEQTRKASQPVGVLTCGSLFKNPAGYKAWELIDKSGCRSIKCGDAGLSDKHCNFLVNHGNATSNDVENLIKLISEKVLEKTGIQLESELIILG